MLKATHNTYTVILVLNCHKHAAGSSEKDGEGCQNTWIKEISNKNRKPNATNRQDMPGLVL
jgi:hypothetical protein